MIFILVDLSSECPLSDFIRPLPFFDEVSHIFSSGTRDEGHRNSTLSNTFMWEPLQPIGQKSSPQQSRPVLAGLWCLGPGPSERMAIFGSGTPVA